MDLTTTYLGMTLRTPLLPSASPLSEEIDNLKRMEDAGAAAVVLHSLFEEQLTRDRDELHFYLTHGTESFAEALTYFPEPEEFHLGPEGYLNHIRKAKEAVDIPVIASLNGASAGGWTSYAKKIEQAGAAAALYGPLHGGANEAVLRMLNEIGSVEKVPEYIKRVKDGEVRLMGFGHRVYKNYDPRAKIIKVMADRVFEVTRRNPLLDIALELERIALEDEYFVKRKLYPNVDFYSGLIYQAMGFPIDMFPVLFAIARTSGWLAQWEEMLLDKEQKIARPRQIYLGPPRRDYVPLEKRG